MKLRNDKKRIVYLFISCQKNGNKIFRRSVQYEIYLNNFSFTISTLDYIKYISFLYNSAISYIIYYNFAFL